MDDKQLTKQEKRELRQKEKEAEHKQRHRKRFLRRASVGVLAVGALAGVFFLMVRLTQNTDPALMLGSVISSNDQLKGNPEARLTLVEYSDFQCPACGAYFPLVKQLSEEFGAQLRLIYRHFPLQQHPHAELAARAAEAAGKQGQFWEMHDLIFENQSSWSNLRNAESVFEEYAESLGLNLEQYRIDVDSKEVKEKVKEDYLSGLRSGVNSTPTFFLNGVQIQNPRSYDEFRNIIINATQ